MGETEKGRNGEREKRGRRETEKGRGDARRAWKGAVLGKKERFFAEFTLNRVNVLRMTEEGSGAG